MSVTLSKLETPIGLVLLKVSPSGIQQIRLDSNFNNKIHFNNLNGKLRELEIEGPITDMHRSAIQWLESFFDTSVPLQPAPPIDNAIVNKNNFTGLVLRTLMLRTAPGDRISYAGLAELCGSPRACRAVGQAMRANPVPLIVPCHRVVASNGGLGHYMSGKGDNLKKWLLEMEAVKSRS